jgi:ATP-dependent helicase HrpA
VLTDSAEAQRTCSASGYVRLVMLQERQTTRYLRSEVKKERALGLHYAPLGSWERLQETLLRASVRHCFFADGRLPESREEFFERIAGRRADWLKIFWRLLAVARVVLERRLQCVRDLDSVDSPAFAPAVEDMRRQLERLVGADFLERIPLQYLDEVPRYLDALGYRLSHLQGRIDRDLNAQQEVRRFEERLDAIAGKVGAQEEYHAVRFAIEELRVALFAQPIGTKGKVSAQRLERMLRPLEETAGVS